MLPWFQESCSSLDLCNELNEVFEASQHHPPNPHYYDPSAANTNANRYADSRPFSYAAGIDAKMLQQRYHGSSANGNSSSKTRAVSEGYPGSDPASVAHGELASRGFQPYSEYRRNESKPSSCSAQGNMNGMVNFSQQDVVSSSGRKSQNPQMDPAYADYCPQGSASRQPPPPPQAAQGGGLQYPPPPPSEMYGGQRVVSQPPVGGVALPGGLGSPRHVHTHHHIVTKPHPSPPASRRGSSASPGRSRSPASSAFQPVASSSSSSSSSQPQQASSSSPPPPPTFPAPPPPLPVHDRYLAATQETRSPSPPLPPPPSGESGAAAGGARGQHSSRTVPGVAAPVAVAPPAVPPANTKGQHQSRSESRRVVSSQSPAGTGESAGRRLGKAVPHGNAGNSAMLAELSQAQLKRAEPADDNGTVHWL